MSEPTPMTEDELQYMESIVRQFCGDPAPWVTFGFSCRHGDDFKLFSMDEDGHSDSGWLLGCCRFIAVLRNLAPRLLATIRDREAEIADLRRLTIAWFDTVQGGVAGGG